MMTRMLRRLRRQEEGYALVTAVLLLSVMMVLMVVALEAGNSALRQTQGGIRWAQALTAAEAGINDAVTRIAEDRAATSPCSSSGSTVCETNEGEYQVDWTGNADGSLNVTSTGYYPTKAAADFTRQIQVLLEPAVSFKYALYSEDTLSIKNNPVVIGDVYSSAGVEVDNNMVICGSVTAANGNVTIGNNTEIVDEYATTGCTGQTGNVWAGGSILGDNGVVIAGDATASAPSGTTCNSTSTNYQIDQGTVEGQATACGRITSTTTDPLAGTNTTPPAVTPLPTFVFDEDNYPSLTCYPSSGSCSQASTSATAVSDFNTYVNANKLSMQGNFAIWQTNPTQATKILLDGIVLSGDLTVISNAPIDFGNTTTISTSASSSEMVVVSLYVPPTGTTCSDVGGDCSIYGQNAVEFDRGVEEDPNDGVVGLLYTTGKMAFKNQGDPGEGALYAGAMDLKNGFDIVYNSRIERVMGFGTNLEATLWQELNV
jgi:hypothetical protein